MIFRRIMDSVTERMATDQQITPRTIFTDILEDDRYQALAWVTGGSAYPNLSGLVKFFGTPYTGVLVEAEIFNLPYDEDPCAANFYGFHIHEYGDCSGSAGVAFADAGGHYNPHGCPHPGHSGDFPPLMSDHGYAWISFYDKRFRIEDIIGRAVVIHDMPDDFASQPAGNSGARIGCGVIRAV